MALETQLLDIPFVGGISSKLDKVIADKNRLFSLSNGTFNKNGTIMPRDTLVSLAAVSGVSELATLGSELVAINGTTGALSSYSPTAGSLVARGTIPRCQSGINSISRSATKKLGLDQATTNGYTCFVWVEATAVRASIVDESSGTFLANNLLLHSGTTYGPARVCVGAAGTFLVAYASSATNIQMCALTASTGAIATAATNIATDSAAVGSYFYDLCSFGTSLGLLVYTSSKAATVYSALCFNAAGTVIAAEITAVASGVLVGNTTCLGLTAFGTLTSAAIMVGDAGSNGIWTAILSLSGSTLSVAHAAALTAHGGSLAITATGVIDPQSGRIQAVICPSGGVNPIFTLQIDSSNTTSAIADVITRNNLSASWDGPLSIGGAFALGGAILFPAIFITGIQTCIFVFDLSGNVLAQSLYGDATYDGYLQSGCGAKTATLATSSGQPSIVSIGVMRLGRLSFVNGNQVIQQGIERIKLTLGRTVRTGATPLWHAQASNCLYFSGAYMGMYDGASVGEAGFFLFPEGITATMAAGASALGLGVYLVVALYEWVDNQGQRHQSAPSPSSTVTLTNPNGGITYAAPPLPVGVRAASCSVVFYRTVAGGTTFYRINSPATPIANDTTVATVGSTDTTMNAATDPISGNEILYTTGGTLPNDMPASCNAIASFQGRLIFSSAEDPTLWLFSQAPVQGQGLYFNEALLGGRTNQDTGTISALGVLDDKLIICTPTRKYWTSGQGPASDGFSGGSFATPQLLPSAVGCIDQRTLVVIPDSDFVEPPLQQSRPGGLAHATLEGLYLLTRGLTDSYIGSAMDSSTSSAYYNTSSIGPGTIQPDKGQVRWCNGSNGTMVYDYIFGQWSNFVFKFSNSAVVPVASVIWNNKWTVAATNNAGDGIAQDTTTIAGKDFGTDAVSIFGQTNWFHLGALQGYQRVRRVVFFGPYGGAGSIEVDSYADYDESGTGAPPSQSTANILTPDGLRWQFRWHLPVQKCQAVKFDFFFTPSTASGGCGFSGITMELGMKKGVAKLKAAQST